MVIPPNTTAHLWQERYNLKDYNTFKINCFTKHFAVIKDAYSLQKISKFTKKQQAKILVLGEGSNVLLPADWPGIVCHMQWKGINVIKENDAEVIVKVAAGENWHQFVESSLKKGWYGLENLALIPGTVGAAPIQNIGAYGAQVADCIFAVECYDYLKQKRFILDKAQCQFAYRNSIFKTEKYQHTIITAVLFRMSKKFIANITYPALKQILAYQNNAQFKAHHIFNAICLIRIQKLPDPKIEPNAGSFFHNPVVNGKTFKKLQQQNPLVPLIKKSIDQYKIPAAWLIEQCFSKGTVHKKLQVGISKQHALVLVNKGCEEQKQVLQFATLIQKAVFERFNIKLAIEPTVIL